MAEMKIIQIDQEVDPIYEATQILKEYPKDTVILNNVKGFDMPVVSGICNTRQKIADSLGCEVSEITQKIIDGMNNPIPVTNFIDPKEEYASKRADLSKIPITSVMLEHILQLVLYLQKTLIQEFKTLPFTECLYWIKRLWPFVLFLETYTPISKRQKHMAKTCRLQ